MIHLHRFIRIFTLKKYGERKLEANSKEIFGLKSYRYFLGVWHVLLNISDEIHLMSLLYMRDSCPDSL